MCHGANRPFVATVDPTRAKSVRRCGYRLQMGDVQLLRSPLDVLMASEHGITNCVAFLTEKTSVEQLFYLSKFLEDRKLESIILI